MSEYTDDTDWQGKRLLQFLKENRAQEDVSKGVDISGMMFILKCLGFELINCAKDSTFTFPSPSTCSPFEIEIRCWQSKAKMLFQKSNNNRQANDKAFQNTPSQSSLRTWTPSPSSFKDSYDPNILSFPARNHKTEASNPVPTTADTQRKHAQSNVHSTVPYNSDRNFLSIAKQVDDEIAETIRGFEKETNKILSLGEDIVAHTNNLIRSGAHTPNINQAPTYVSNKTESIVVKQYVDIRTPSDNSNAKNRISISVGRRIQNSGSQRRVNYYSQKITRQSNCSTPTDQPIPIKKSTGSIKTRSARKTELKIPASKPAVKFLTVSKIDECPFSINNAINRQLFS